MLPNSSDCPSPAKKTILIVDDHPILRRGLAALINQEPDLAVCGEAATCQAAMELIGQEPPDLVLVDIALKGSDGLDLVKNLKRAHPTLPALVISMHDEAVYAERALRAGARGYVSKEQLDDTVLSAIRRVFAGEIYLSETLQAQFATQFLGRNTPNASSAIAALSDRELQVFRLLGQGRTTRQIAATLQLSIKTIESHCEHLKQKLTVTSMVELAHRATQWLESSGCA